MNPVRSHINFNLSTALQNGDLRQLLMKEQNNKTLYGMNSAKTAPRKTPYSLRVMRSDAGLGLFTNDSIKSGKFVIEYHGHLLSDDEAEKKGGKYLCEINSKWTIDGTPRKNIARYINHSCRPNCEAVAQGKHVFVYARRGIKSGEELTYDYGKEYWVDYIKPYGCLCAKCN